jgi:hypothetical protein
VWSRRTGSRILRIFRGLRGAPRRARAQRYRHRPGTLPRNLRFRQYRKTWVRASRTKCSAPRPPRHASAPLRARGRCGPRRCWKGTCGVPTMPPLYCPPRRAGAASIFGSLLPDFSTACPQSAEDLGQPAGRERTLLALLTGGKHAQARGSLDRDAFQAGRWWWLRHPTAWLTA